MKKKSRAISKFYNGKYIAAIILFALFQFIPGIGLIGYVLCNLTIAGILFAMVAVFPAGVYTVDKRGIAMRVGFKKYYHEWNEFRYVDVFRTTTEIVGGETRAFTYWVYFSNDPDVNFDVLNAVGKAGATLDRAVCFQYRKKDGERMREVLPEHLKEQWLALEKLLGRTMNFWSRLYNR